MLYLLLTAGLLVMLALLWQLVKLRERLAGLELRVSRLDGRKSLPAITLWLLTGSASGQSPADAVAVAAADLRRLPPALQVTTRFLSLHAIPVADREKAVRVLSFHCNGLSRESDIVPPALVGNLVLRVSLADYDWPAEVWEKLFDPCFHVKIEPQIVHATRAVPWPGGTWPGDGKHYAAGSFTYHPKVAGAGRATALAPWLPLAEAADLVNLTQSQSPIVRADWFLWQTAIQADRTPGYYDFIGVKDKKDFDKLVGFDAKLAKDARRVELLEAVATSTVTLQPRRIGIFPAISGNYFQTFDSRQAVDEHNPLRILNGGFKFDAQEVFGHLPNGLMAWGLFDDKGVRQDAAPDFIASDSTAHGTDRRVHSGLSCIRCHLPNAGIQPVDGWARNLFTGGIKLQSPDYDKLRDLRQKYLRDLEGPMEDSRRTYTRSILQACGMKPPELGAAYGKMFADHDAPVTLARAARDAGVEPQRLENALALYVKTTGALDTVAAAFISKRKGGIRPEQYFETIPTIQLALRGYLAP